ncbi:hypothetical protein EDB82DRAFT_485911 [Fusarium venenatum]|uniref:uncharacterized protein n=1 Tax=Fusarium venenatum TaxID=56646 RepID=UPI001DF5ABA9|nr:hypothetical protein EDB82DRAFT_485911 [Fusarium venenatum]
MIFMIQILALFTALHSTVLLCNCIYPPAETRYSVLRCRMHTPASYIIRSRNRCFTLYCMYVCIAQKVKRLRYVAQTRRGVLPVRRWPFTQTFIIIVVFTSQPLIYRVISNCSPYRQ